MKAIISHDIDHVTAWEHLFRDTILPKFLVRNQIEFFSGRITLQEYILRYGEFFTNKWNNIDELIAFNEEKGVPSYFFIAVANGTGLSYSLEQAEHLMKKLNDAGCAYGIHGIAHSNPAFIEKEKTVFTGLSQNSSPGIRMHYARKNDETLQLLAQVGYSFDSTEHSFNRPYKIDGMWELPFQVMDSWIIQKGRRWQTNNLSQACEETKRMIEEAHRLELPYLGIDFHDRYFSPAFRTWRNWYIWLVDYLASNEIRFISFADALKELEVEPI
jgi:peptidoglycan/xylan/chitin deacetylase (PgdA/CDA1 family)